MWLPLVKTQHRKGVDMLYVFIFDFALVGLLFSSAVFLVWCWIGFLEDRKPHPIYRRSVRTQHKTDMKERAQRYA